MRFLCYIVNDFFDNFPANKEFAISNYRKVLLINLKTLSTHSLGKNTILFLSVAYCAYLKTFNEIDLFPTLSKLLRLKSMLQSFSWLQLAYSWKDRVKKVLISNFTIFLIYM